MHSIGNQPDAKDKFSDDDCTSHQKAEIQTKEMVTIDVKLKLVHVENLQHGGNDEDKSEKNLQDDGSYFPWRVFVYQEL